MTIVERKEQVRKEIEHEITLLEERQLYKAADILEYLIEQLATERIRNTAICDSLMEIGHKNKEDTWKP